MIILDINALHQLRQHAAYCAPRECCGVVVDNNGSQQYIECENIADENTLFVLSPRDYAKAAAVGEVLLIAHSHPNKSNAQPSTADVACCNRGNVPWVIVNTPGDDVQYIAPTGATAQYTGREYIHGVFDCATLIQDYYAQEYGVSLIYDVPESREWWKTEGDRYTRYLAANKFVQIEEHKLLPGDIIVMQIRADVPNHAAIYLGGNVILQHCYKNLSRKDVYGGFWKKHARTFWRHPNANN